MIGSGHLQAKGALILHLDDKNLPPVRTTSFCFISERYFENHYRSDKRMVYVNKFMFGLMTTSGESSKNPFRMSSICAMSCALRRSL